MAKENETGELDAESKTIISEELAAAEKEDKDKQPEMIPKERLDAVIAENKAKDVMLETLQKNFDLVRANIPQPKIETEAKPASILDGIFTEDDTIVEKRQLETVLNRVLSHINNLAGQFAVQQQHGDFQEVLAEHLPEVVKADPTLFSQLQALYKANPALAGATAYRLAKTSPTYLEKQNKAKTAQQDIEKTNTEIQALLKNRSLPQSISALGTGGGTGGTSGSALFDKVMQAESAEDFNKLFDDLSSGAVKLTDLT